MSGEAAIKRLLDLEIKFDSFRVGPHLLSDMGNMSDYLTDLRESDLMCRRRLIRFVSINEPNEFLSKIDIMSHVKCKCWFPIFTISRVGRMIAVCNSSRIPIKFIFAEFPFIHATIGSRSSERGCVHWKTGDENELEIEDISLKALWRWFLVSLPITRIWGGSVFPVLAFRVCHVKCVTADVRSKHSPHTTNR
eukprot:Gregarina_sp_Poly_1__8444@NODE_497_length_7922_cov_26_990834_g53_i1_p4_GENE_NODE_497_length_7922_cov_26_990834_g53_i1NODE_497_length_7922_cov_26_990834_g53_i1_p4_ORF_typecomplete_len193_score17_70_NODE_497_length_7922_cov_26_990834_g53_i15071085